MQLTLFARDKELYNAWRIVFDPLIQKGAKIDIVHLSFDMLPPHEAVVTAGNSFGIMDGGIDLVMRDYFYDIQSKVQRQIEEKFYGIQPIGSSIAIETGDDRFKYLIYTPTMVAPMPIHQDNILWAFRSALTLANAMKLNSIACCGLGALTGRVPPLMVATMMYYAYRTQHQTSFEDWDIVDKVFYKINE